ncbi:hypothetical protein, partial [Vibrio parahaemolyticus]|uniref:hypothetical protein n=1 Tax=Vibrio parahaemolyticus TaxID=670 RepID=UPI001C60A4A6
IPNKQSRAINNHLHSYSLYYLASLTLNIHGIQNARYKMPHEKYCSYLMAKASQYKLRLSTAIK